MICEYIGARSGNFKDDNGNDVFYAKICVKVPFETSPYGLDGWAGSNWDILKCPYDNFDKLVADIETGDNIDVSFDRKGKVESIKIVNKSS